MASLFSNPTYLTATELKDSTNVAGLISVTDTERNRYIVESENIIDSYIGFIRKYDSTQARKFPTIKDGASYLPVEIKQACVYICESMYLMGAPTSIAGGEIKSEKVGDHSIEFTTSEDMSFETIPSKSKAILDMFKNPFFGSKTVYGGGTYLQQEND